MPSGQAFLEQLADGLADDFCDSQPDVLASVAILLPTRRATRRLKEAFLLSNNSTTPLLPRIYAIGDIEEEDSITDGSDSISKLINKAHSVPPTMSPTRQKILLAKLIHRWWSLRTDDNTKPFDQALHVARGLVNFLDHFQTARLDISSLDTLVPEDYAAHWRETIDFLRIITEQWPAFLEEQNLVDPATRRTRMLENLSQQWEDNPPTTPVLAAGSTGSLPATMDLLAVVAKLPLGCVLLPGLDQGLDQESWEAIGETHPQHGLKRLLHRLRIERSAVPNWGDMKGYTGNVERRRLLSEVMRPEPTCTNWHKIVSMAPVAVQGLSRVTCTSLAAEATVIAMMMRNASKTAGHTAALVTPDRELARRVKVELRRWKLSVDDSAGIPFLETSVGVFLHLIANMANAQASPIPLLAMLKHPLCAGGTTHMIFRNYVAELERSTLRGSPPASGFKGLLKELSSTFAAEELVGWFQSIASAGKHLLSLTSSASVSLGDVILSHISFAEWLTINIESPGITPLWETDGGETAKKLLGDLAVIVREASPIHGKEYASIFVKLLSDVFVRPKLDVRSHLYIWAPLEARLQQADFVIVGGLNEGTWPRHTIGANSWLSRSMRHSLGLPGPEQTIGLSAHDFSQLFCAPNVVLTRSAKNAGAGTVPSRWLVRLEAVLRRVGLAERTDRSAHWTALSALLDKATESHRQIKPPAPCPPLSARPRQMSVTHVEQWMHNPYEVYARDILRLRPLRPVNAPHDAADYGNTIHAILDRFVQEYPSKFPDEALDHLLSIGMDYFSSNPAKPSVQIFWWSRFERMANWFIGLERARRTEIVESLAEQTGSLKIDAPGGTFTLTAKADRIDRYGDGTLDIIDYKTGLLPSRAKVSSGEAPQLPLEAAIANRGGFKNLVGGPSRALVYVRLSGGEPAGETWVMDQDVSTLSEEALSGVKSLVAAFDNHSTPYCATPIADQTMRHSAYRHLARVLEWSSGGDEQ